MRQTIFTPADKRGVVLPGVPADHGYKFEVHAYRKVDKNISASGVILSTTALTSVAYRPTVTPNFTGEIQGRASIQVVQNLEAIASDNVLSTTEKPATIMSYNQVKSQHDTLQVRATAMGGLTTVAAAAQVAMTALTGLLTGLKTESSVPAWNDTTGHTPINASTYLAAWSALYLAVADLDAAVTAKAAQTAIYSSVSGTPTSLAGINGAEGAKLSTVSSYATAGDNLVFNGGLEVDTTNWTFTPGWARKVGAPGDPAPFYFSCSSNGAELYQTVKRPIPATRRLFASIYTLLKQGGPGYFAIYYYDGGGAQISEVRHEMGYSGPNSFPYNEWVLNRFVIDAPANAASFSFLFFCYGLGSTTDAFQIANVRISPTQIGADVTQQDPKVISIEAGATASDNLIRNGAMKINDPLAYNGMANGAIVAGTANDPTNFKYVLYEGNPFNQGGNASFALGQTLSQFGVSLPQNAIPVGAGETLFLSFLYKATSAFGSAVIAFFDKNLGYLGQASTGYMATSSSWILRRLSGIAPANTALAQVSFGVLNILGLGFDAEFTTFRLSKTENSATLGAPAGTRVAGILAESLTAQAADAQIKGTNSLAEINIIQSDGYLSRGEKPDILRQWNDILMEFPGVSAQATELGVSTINYVSARQALSDYLSALSPAWDNTLLDTAIVPATFNGKFSDYYFARQTLLNDMADKASTTSTWDGVTGSGKDALVAQAIDAQTKAISSLATIAVIQSDGWLSAGEKPDIIRQWADANAEKGGLYAQALAMGLESGSGSAADNYAYAHELLGTYLAQLNPAWNNTAADTPIVPATFNAKFAAYYSTKQALLNVMAAKAASTSTWVGTVGGGKPETYTLGAQGISASPPAGFNLGLRNAAGGAFTDSQGPTSATFARSYTVCWRISEAYWAVRHFDVWGPSALHPPSDYGIGAAGMATCLNAIAKGTPVVIYTSDEPARNRLTGGLPEAIYRCGGSRTIFANRQWAVAGAYLLVGEAGCGEGNGVERFQDGGADNSPNSYVRTAFAIVNGQLMLDGQTIRDAGDLAFSDGRSLDDLANVQEDADVTALNQHSISPINDVAVAATYTGATKAGQLPQARLVRRLLGATDVSSQADVTASASGGVAISVDNTPNGAQRGLITIEPQNLPTETTVTGSSTYLGLIQTFSFKLRRYDDAPPTSGGGGGGGGSGGSASGPSSVSVSTPPGESTTYIEMARTTVVTTGSGGSVQTDCNLYYYATSEGAHNGELGGGLTGAALVLQLQYSTDGGSTWTAAEGAVQGSHASTYFNTGFPKGPVQDAGSVYANVTVSGLGSGTLVIIRALGASSNSDPHINSVSGSLSASPS